MTLLALGALCVWLAWGALRNLFADYQDSPAWVYVLLGGFWLLLALSAAVFAWRVLRTPPR